MAKYERLSALDRSFLDVENQASHMHVAGVMILDSAPLTTPSGGIDIDRIRAGVAASLPMMTRYRQRIERVPVGGQPVWVDDDRFNLDYHVRHTALPRPGDEDQLKRLAGRIFSQQLDRGKPLWETWVIEGLDGGRFAMISKTHHCMIDGISAVDLVSTLLSPSPDVVELPPAAPWNPDPAPTPGELLVDEATRRIRSPFQLGETMLEAFQNPLDAFDSFTEQLGAIGETIGAGFSPASDTPFNHPIGPHRRFDWMVMDLAEVKSIKNRLGGTVNDVVLATVAGAVGAFLARRGFPPERISSLDFRALVPVSVRTAAQRGTLGNRIAAWPAPLPIAEPDPRRRLEAVHAITADLKQSRQAMGAEVLARVSEWTVSTLLTVAMRMTARARAYNITVTNVPGPQMPLYMLGSRLLAAYPMGPLFENQALNIALLSYDGKLHWGLNADFDALPDLREMIAALQASFAALQKAAS
ncbi:MAG TPA: wax ester/triacylglycerol synthase family O-acyltransferase [Candidatus Binataceae bacterium]|nr:wax ester/triacylglycerol synthase family O-acyltransferase [Candidatus Binataceae bacterium]